MLHNNITLNLLLSLPCNNFSESIRPVLIAVVYFCDCSFVYLQMCVLECVVVLIFLGSLQLVFEGLCGTRPVATSISAMS